MDDARRDLLLLTLLAGIGGGLLLAPELGLISGFSTNHVLVFGLFIGLMSGGLGMGGVWLMVPLMRFLFGVSTRTAIGTALTAQVLITLVGSYRHFSNKSVGWKLAVPLIIGGVIGTPIGTALNAMASATVLNWLYAVLLGGIGVKMSHELYRSGGNTGRTDGRDLTRDIVGDEAITRAHQRAHSVIASFSARLDHIAQQLPEEIEDDYHGSSFQVDTTALLVAGIGFGIINSLLGTSTTVMVPFLDIVMRLSSHVATAVSLMNVTAISVPASINHIGVGNVIYGLAAGVAAGGIIGTLVGSDINETLPDRGIQYIMVVVLFAMAYYMLPV